MSQTSVPVNRFLVGVIACVCFLTGLGIYLFVPAGEEMQGSRMWSAAFLRVGVLMSAFWLALPSKNRDAAWTNLSLGQSAGVLLAIVGIVLRPKIAIPLLIVLGVVGYFLRPRARQYAPRPWETEQKGHRDV